MNSINLIGRMVSDVELKSSNDGTKYTYLTIAVNNGKDKDATFVPCVAWGKTAELINTYLGKGSQIGASGKVNYWSKKDDNGNFVNGSNVTINHLTMLSDGNKSDNQSGGFNNSQDTTKEVNLEEIKF